MATAPASPVVLESAPEPITRADTTAHDDRVRKTVAIMMILQFVVVAGGIGGYMVFRDTAAAPITNGVLSILIMLEQAEIAFMTLVLGYYFGSSSSSTSKSVALEKSQKAPA